MKRYEFLTHTADVAVRVYGGSLKELFVSAALAMTSVLVARKGNRKEAFLEDVTIAKSEESLEDLLKSWLDELLYYFSAKRLVLHRVKTLTVGDTEFDAVVLLEKFDEEFFEAKDEIKAVTYHNLEVKRTKRGWLAKIIFDV